MNRAPVRLSNIWSRLGPEMLPFADAATDDLPLLRLLRLSLFQVTTGMAIVLLNGALNRVMIVELGLSAALVSLMIALPLIFAPARALIGFRSDNLPSYLGWRRVPFICIGSMLQFGGLAILPFALINLSGDTSASMWMILAATSLAFLMIGCGLHTTQTAGLALATDLAPKASRARVVALLYVMLLVGMVLSSILFSWLLTDFSQIRLIQVIQGAAVVSLILNMVALWKQESLNPALTRPDKPRPHFIDSWREYLSEQQSVRFLLALGLGTAAFSMQDILLEPYGGQVLALGVGATTLLTAIITVGMLSGLALSARSLSNEQDPYRLAAYGVTVGLFAFAAVVFSAPVMSPTLFRCGTFMIGFGTGMFSVGMLSAAMTRGGKHNSGLVLGAWGAVQATAAGVAIALGGALRDLVGRYAESDAFGSVLNTPETGYMFVYHIEILLLFLTLAVMGPLVGREEHRAATQSTEKFELAQFPG